MSVMRQATLYRVGFSATHLFKFIYLDCKKYRRYLYPNEPIKMEVASSVLTKRIIGFLEFMFWLVEDG